MNKGIIAAIVVAVAGYLGYNWYSGNQAKLAEEAASMAAEADAKAAEEAAAAAEAEAKAAEEAAAAAEAEAKAAEEAAAQAAEEAAAAAEVEAKAAEEAAAQAAEEAAAATEEAASNPIMDLLTEDGFDPAKLGEAIEGSELGTVQKAALQAAVAQAANNPEMVSTVIDQIKTALGLGQ